MQYNSIQERTGDLAVHKSRVESHNHKVDPALKHGSDPETYPTYLIYKYIYTSNMLLLLLLGERHMVGLSLLK